MKTALRTGVLFIALATGSSVQAIRADQTSRVAATLLSQFETVFRAEAKLLADSGSYRGLAEQDSNELRVPFGFLAAGLDGDGQTISQDLMHNAADVFVGAREFLSPNGLGRERSQYCFVVVFTSDPTQQLQNLFKGKAFSAKANYPVWHWTKSLGEFGENDPTPSSFYASAVQGQYMLLCNNLGDLQTVVNHLAPDYDSSGELAALRSLTLLEGREYWGYRRFRNPGIPAKGKSDDADTLPGVEALSLTITFDTKAATLRVHAPDERAVVALNSDLARTRGAGLSPLTGFGPDVWGTTFSLSGDRRSGESMFQIMGLFGFAVYL